MTATPAPRSLGVCLALGASAALAMLAAPPAKARAKTSAACASQFTATISPGFTTTPSAGTQTTDGETGTIACVGKLNGRRVTGLGTVGFDATYNDATCAAESSSGTVTVTIPTTVGDQHLVGSLTVRRTALGIRAEAQFDGSHYSGAGFAIPLQGNCLVTPLQRVLIVLTGTISSTK